MRLITALLVGALAGTLAFAADAQKVLDGLSGNLMVGEYFNGAQFTERYHSEHTTTLVSPEGTFTGLIQARGAHLCFVYPALNRLTGNCFRILTRGDNCYLFFQVGNPTSEANRHAGLGWDARGWRDEEPSTCTGDLVS